MSFGDFEGVGSRTETRAFGITNSGIFISSSTTVRRPPSQPVTYRIGDSSRAAGEGPLIEEVPDGEGTDRAHGEIVAPSGSSKRRRSVTIGKHGSSESSFPEHGNAPAPMGTRVLPDYMLSILQSVSTVSREFEDHRFLFELDKARRRRKRRREKMNTRGSGSSSLPDRSGGESGEGGDSGYGSSLSESSLSSSSCSSSSSASSTRRSDESSFRYVGTEGADTSCPELTDAEYSGAISGADASLGGGPSRVAASRSNRRARGKDRGRIAKSRTRKIKVHYPSLTREELHSLTFSAENVLYTVKHLNLARKAAGTWCAGCMLSSADASSSESVMKSIHEVLTNGLQARSLVAAIRTARQLYDKIEVEAESKPRWLIWSIFFHIYDHLRGNPVVSAITRYNETRSMQQDILLKGVYVKFAGGDPIIDARLVSAYLNTGKHASEIIRDIQNLTGSSETGMAGSAATAGTQGVLVRTKFQGKDRAVPEMSRTRKDVRGGYRKRQRGARNAREPASGDVGEGADSGRAQLEEEGVEIPGGVPPKSRHKVATPSISGASAGWFE